MCGIIAVVRRRSQRGIPNRAAILELLGPVADQLSDDDLASLGLRLEGAASALEATNALLRGVPGVEALLQLPDLRAAVAHETDRVASAIGLIDTQLDAGAAVGSDRL